MKQTVLAALLCIASTPSPCQTPAWQSFDVASVKLHPLPEGAFGFGPGGGTGSIAIRGNRISIAQSTITGLMMTAFNVRDFQISDMPEWVRGRDQYYDIVAEAGEGSALTIAQARPMLRELLAQRFQLHFHYETKDMPVYSLTVGRNGSKLKESAGPGPHRPPMNNGTVMELHLVDRPISDIIALIAPYLDRPPIDNTGLRERYDFSIELPRGKPDPVGAESSVSSAVESLGLKLAPARMPTEMIVIDHIERPSAN